MPRYSLPRARFALRPAAPYSLERTAGRFARFAERVDVVRDGAYERLLVLGREALLVRATQVGPPSRPRLELVLVGKPARRKAARAAAERLVERVLGTRHRLRAFYRQAAGDPLLAGALRAERGLSLAGHASLFEALVTSILSQQINLSFAYSIRAELVEAFGRRARIDGETRFAFPSPRRLARESPDALRRFRLSEAKARALHGVARAFAGGELDEDELRSLDDETVVERLTALRGIGRWTAETALIRGLGRIDAFPAGDLGVVKYLARGLLGHRDTASEAEMRAFSERWRPFRSYALIYAYAELARRRKESG